MRQSRLLRPFKPGIMPSMVVASFDLESKKPDSEEQGFERPFMVGIYVNGEYKSFFDEPHLDPNDPERAFKPGGCIHEFFRWLTESPAGRKLEHRARKKKEPPAVFYGHNAGGFDALHLLRWLRRSENAKNFDICIIASGSHLLELAISEKSNKLANEEAPFDDDEDGSNVPAKNLKAQKLRKWIFRDSMRLVPGSLESIGKKLLLETQKTKMERSKGGMSTPTSDRAAWENYNRADCKTVTSLVEVLVKQLDKLGGHLKMTLPACAMDLFRRRFLNEFLNTETIDEEANPFYGKQGIPRERHFPGCCCICNACRQENCFKTCPNIDQVRPPCPATPYGCLHAWLVIAPTGAGHGGRTEVFHHQETEGRLRYFDRNSSYAAAMTEPIPIRLKYSFGPGRGPQTLEECKEYADDGLVGFIEAIVNIPETVNIPPLPVVHDNKLIFPVGRFYGRWDWTELRHLEEIGGSIELLHQSVWYTAAPILRSMMNTLFAIRSEAKKAGNTPLAEVCKLICNATFGKFFQSPEREEIFTAPIGSEPEGAEAISPEELAYASDDESIMWRRPKYAEAMYFLPHIGGHITALAREALWLQTQRVEKQGGKVFYTDTDSVVCDVDLPSSDELGEWKQEYGHITKLSGDFDSPKSYRLVSLDPKQCFDGQHTDECKARRENEDSTALACKGCALELVHIKGLHRSKHTPENFERLRRGETVPVPDQPPKLGELMALNFRRYETKNRDKSNLRWRDGLTDEPVVSKRVRKGPSTSAIVFDETTPTIYVENGQARKTTQATVFSYFYRWRDHVINGSANHDAAE